MFRKGSEVRVDIAAFIRIQFEEPWRSIHDDMEEHDRSKVDREERFIA